jgi:hypothetical protein
MPPRLQRDSKSDNTEGASTFTANMGLDGGTEQGRGELVGRRATFFTRARRGQGSSTERLQVKQAIAAFLSRGSTVLISPAKTARSGPARHASPSCIVFPRWPGYRA